MMLIVRLACIVYWVYVTLLLLVPEPSLLVGFGDGGVQAPERGVHLASFAFLTILVLASRWPIARRCQILALVVYALATESLQSFVPQRCVELLDYAENLLGIACGACAVWAWGKVITSRTARSAQRNTEAGPPCP